MTPYDVGMAAVIVAGMVWGAWRGITWQLASVLSLGLGYLVAFPMSSEVAPHFPGPPLIAQGLAMLVLYAAVSAGVFGIAWSIRAGLKRLKFEAFDRHLGMVLGGVVGAGLGIVATVLIVSFAPQSRTPILTSPAGKAVDHVLMLAKPALPEGVQTILEPYWEALERGTPGEILADESVSAGPIEADEPDRDGTPIGPKADPGFLRSMFERKGAEAGRSFADQWEEFWPGAASDDRNPRR